MAELKRNEKIDIVELLKDLDKYEPRRRAGPGEKEQKISTWVRLNIARFPSR